MKNILYVSLVDWFWIKQRPHHVPEILSRNNRVVYFSGKGWRSVHYLKHSRLNERKYTTKAYFKLNENFTIIRKRILPNKKMSKIVNPLYRFARGINSWYIKRYLEYLNYKNKFDVIIVTTPNHLTLLSKELLKGKLVIYDCMDNYKEFNQNTKEELIQRELELLRICDKVVVSSDGLYKEITKYDVDGICEKTFVINNGVDVKHFDPENVDQSRDITFLRSSKKKVAYIGTISSWVDLGLIQNMAKQFKDVNFYIIGPLDRNFNKDKYSQTNNMIFTGTQPYEIIPTILSKVDISIMPFQKNQLVKAVNPVKIYESLAMGKPVIATRYEETEKFGDLIFTYDTSEEFESILSKLLSQNEEENIIRRRIEFARENSWEKRVEQIEKLWENL